MKMKRMAWRQRHGENGVAKEAYRSGQRRMLSAALSKSVHAVRGIAMKAA